MLPFPQIILLEQKYTHHVLKVHDVKFLQQFLLYLMGAHWEALGDGFHVAALNLTA